MARSTRFWAAVIAALGLGTGATGDAARQARGSVTGDPDALRTLPRTAPGLEEVDGRLLLAGAPVTAVVEDRDENDRLRERSEYHDGRRHGLCLRYYESGQLQWSRLYADGRKVGLHRGWWPNGQLQFAARFEAGEYAGNQLVWHDNGRVHLSRHYASGHEEGRQRAWTEDGTLFANYEVRSGRRYGLLGSRPCFTVGGAES